jgi:hypothetical protein
MQRLTSSFQIRDWLTLEEEMLRQQAVVVGDVDDILQVLDKQKVRRFSCTGGNFLTLPLNDISIFQKGTYSSSRSFGLP